MQLSRLQAVDVVQPIVARLVGLAELKPEVAGGESGKVVVRLPRVRPTRRRSATSCSPAPRGSGRGDQEAAPLAPERILVRVPPRDLALSLLISESLIVGVVDRRRRASWSRSSPRGSAPSSVSSSRSATPVLGSRQRFPRELRLHRRRVAGRAPAPTRAALHAVADRAAWPGPGDRDRPAAALAPLRLGACSASTSPATAATANDERGREHAAASRWHRSPSPTPCSRACSPGSRSNASLSSPRRPPRAGGPGSSTRVSPRATTTRSSSRGPAVWSAGCR